jgi:hypothetical protein
MVFLSFGGQGWPQAVLTIASAGGLTNTGSMLRLPLAGLAGGLMPVVVG